MNPGEQQGDASTRVSPQGAYAGSPVTYGAPDAPVAYAPNGVADAPDVPGSYGVGDGRAPNGYGARYGSPSNGAQVDQYGQGAYGTAPSLPGAERNGQRMDAHASTAGGDGISPAHGVGEGVIAPQAPQAPQRRAPSWPGRDAQPVMPIYSVDEQLRKRRARSVTARLLLFLLDAVMINAAFYAAYYIRFVVLHGVQFTTTFINEPFSSFTELEVVVTVGLLTLFYARGLYHLRSTGTWFKQFWIIGSAATTGFAIFAAYDYVLRQTDISLSGSRSLVALTWLLIIVIVSFMRLLAGGFLTMLYRRGHWLTGVLVIGSGRLGKLMMQQITATPNLGYRIVGFISDGDEPPTDFGRFKSLGGMDDIDRVIRQQRITEAIIALPSHQHQQILRTVQLCERAGADFKLVPDLYELSLARIDVDAIEGIPLIGLRRSLTGTLQYRVKRVIDVVGASCVLLIGAPIWLLTALAIKLDSPGPVLHHQTRLGYRGQPFDCFKFRSMYVNADQMLERLRAALPEDERGKFKLRNDPRRTRVGGLIRRTSLDEIPQLLNVIRGDMSLIGPRPPLPAEFERYEDWEKARLEMPPGVTGLWQVRGRSDIDFNEMVLMDLYYIENWSLRLDIQILLQTIPAVLGSKGAY
ncbi:MAG TPA: exopolysaccharide biosynthesis polyprenyl glycosylphosphotransferase [Ktedonobacterales bacterium]|nr:exopolysaccharide biosynthesis polyprenyl glycosylphosphotransferase [Ktedonobacterales bacterium]